MSKIAVIYWSMSGNTEAMANAIAEGAQGAGAEVDVKESEFEPFFTQLEGRLGGKKVALFGSYGWGDGQWMRDWQQRVDDANASLYHGEGLIINETPDDDGLEQCRQFGAGFAGF